MGHISQLEKASSDTESYEVFHLMKRGKQHKRAGAVEASGFADALWRSKNSLDPGKPVFNVWVIKSSELVRSEEEDIDLWKTLPEKTFRDAIEYRGADKIKRFKEEQVTQ